MKFDELGQHVFTANQEQESKWISVALDCVEACTTIDICGARIGHQLDVIIARSGEDDLFSSIAGDENDTIVAVLAVDGVAAGAIVNLVIAKTAADAIVASTAIDEVIAGFAEDDVVIERAEEYIGIVGANERRVGKRASSGRCFQGHQLVFLRQFWR